jgi:hypothetical protein
MYKYNSKITEYVRKKVNKPEILEPVQDWPLSRDYR